MAKKLAGVAKSPVKRKPVVGNRIAEFVAEYLIHFNATKAAAAIGFPKEHAKMNGYRMMQKPEVRAAIKAAQDERLERLKMTADEVLIGLARVARFDVRKLYREDGSLIPVHELDDETAMAIAGIDVDVRHEQNGDDEPVMVETRKIKASDRMKALESLGRVHGLFEKDNKQQQPILFDVSFGD